MNLASASAAQGELNEAFQHLRQALNNSALAEAISNQLSSFSRFHSDTKCRKAWSVRRPFRRGATVGSPVPQPPGTCLRASHQASLTRRSSPPETFTMG
jgi:hypothetical protein